jgi:general secretion pathway protein A
MYEQYYGLHERPFDLTPNPRFLFLTAKHREALSTLEYGISLRRGIIVLIGQVGTGKTTLVRTVLDSFRPPTNRCVHVNNPTLTRNEFFELLTAEFGLSSEAATSKARFLLELERGIVERRRSHGVTALIIDEAQGLPDVLLEEVRLLANIETVTEKLLPVVLVGQPELGERLEQTGLRQLKQRVALRCEIGALDIRETAAYIAGRIRIAGGNATEIFTRDAVAAIYERSRGIPRTISVICDNALVNGFATDVKPISRQIILEVCRDLELRGGRPGADSPNSTLGTAARGPARPTDAGGPGADDPRVLRVERPRPTEVGARTASGRREPDTPAVSRPSGYEGDEVASRSSDAASPLSLFRHFGKRWGFPRFWRAGWGRGAKVTDDAADKIDKGDSGNPSLIAADERF